MGAGVYEFWGRIHSLAPWGVAGCIVEGDISKPFASLEVTSKMATLFRGYLEGGGLTRNVSNEVDEFGGVSRVTMTGPVSQCWAPNGGDVWHIPIN